MVEKALLETHTARSIVRKADLRFSALDVPPPEPPEPPTWAQGPSFLAVRDPEEPTVTQGVPTSSNFLRIRYHKLLYDTGLGFNDNLSVSQDYSFICPTSGIYRIDAQVGVWRTDYSTGVDSYLFTGPQANLHRRHIWMGAFDADLPVVLCGNHVAYMSSGAQMSFQVRRDTSATGSSVTISNRSDERYSRLLVELIWEGTIS
jgi:hypothetical protein